MTQLAPQSTVLIIGSGLTMVDAVVSLEQAGHRGPIEVFSRHGLLPHVRRQPPTWDDFLAADHSLSSPRQLLGEVRRQCQLALEQGVDWQAPLDTVRVHIARLWSQASEAQKRQFVRHVRPLVGKPPSPFAANECAIGGALARGKGGCGFMRRRSRAWCRRKRGLPLRCATVVKR